MKYLTIDGKRMLWKDILKLRQEQKKAEHQTQLTLFELREDARPFGERTADERYESPSLLDYLKK